MNKFPTNYLMKQISATLVLLTLGLVATSQATLLIYEGYNYALSNGASFNGVTINATGLTGNYTTVESNTGTIRYSTTGLSFGSNFFTSVGGAADITMGVSNDAAVRLSAAINTGAQTGTLWNSYLVNIDQESNRLTRNSSMLTRVANSNGDDSTRRFMNAADAPGNSPAITAGAPGVGYDNTAVDASPTTALTLNTTYLLLARFTNVGTALSGGSPGVATQWIFTQSQYDNWRTAGGSAEGTLGTYAGWTATESLTSGTFAFDNTLFFQVNSFGQGNGKLGGLVDENRWGTTLASVAIPEPSTWALLAVSLTALVVFRRRRVA